MAKIYALDEGKNSIETMSREQIMTAIIQAVESGTIKDIDEGFITKIQDINHKKDISLWFGTREEFEALNTKAENVLYFITDETTLEDIESLITNLEESNEAQSKAITEIRTQITPQFEAIGWTGGQGLQDLKYTLVKQSNMVLFNCEISGDFTTNIYLEFPNGYKPLITSYLYKNRILAIGTNTTGASVFINVDVTEDGRLYIQRPIGVNLSKTIIYNAVWLSEV